MHTSSVLPSPSDSRDCGAGADTQYFNVTLARYRASSHDSRAIDELPARVLSQLLQDAQALKQAANMEAWIRRSRG